MKVRIGLNRIMTANDLTQVIGKAIADVSNTTTTRITITTVTTMITIDMMTIMITTIAIDNCS